MKKLAGWLKIGLFYAIGFAVAFVVVEGVSSALLLAYEIVLQPNPGLSSRSHVQHDELLGWSNIPDTSIPDLYGPGVGLTTNSRGFRGTPEVDARRPPGARRAVCLGDSFTLGVGVADADTWCNRLVGLDPNLEVANLGEAGYGLGQAFLRYERDAEGLEHDLLLFAFIGDDFRRLTVSKFVAWHKPKVTLRDGELVTEGVPVPRRSALMPWLTYNQGKFLRLRSVDLGGRLLGRFSSPAPAGKSWRETSPEIALRLFERVHALAAERGAEILLIYLPERITTVKGEQERARWLTDELAVRGIPFLDLVSEIHGLPVSEVEGLYDPVWDHFTAEGHRVTAGRIHERVQQAGSADAID